VVALNFQPLDIKLFVILTCDGIDLQDDMEVEADTTITGSPMSLAMMGVHESSTTSLFSGDVKIEGDIELGNQFQAFLENVEVDWEEPLSQITGDVIANQVGNAVRDFSAWLKESSETNGLNVSEYFREEQNMLPSKFEVERFKKNIDELRFSADRLEAKVNRLITKIQKNAEEHEQEVS
jgi:ubiquinone biosynthesis protein UbiJ